MSLLSIELSDAGIVAAGGFPAELRPVEGSSMVSPGVALQRDDELIVGRGAADQARLYPKQTISRFWDRLDTAPLRRKGFTAATHAELAYAHLKHLWPTLSPATTDIVVCVPGHYSREQLGLLLGIAGELGMRVTAFFPTALTAVDTTAGSDLIHIDLHLHRCEATYLTVGDDVVQVDTASIADGGLARLYGMWARTAAREFLRATRFDLMYSAASEQAVYRRLPDLLTSLAVHPSVRFDMHNGNHSYRMALARSVMVEAVQPVYAEISELVTTLLARNGLSDRSPALQLSHRACGLPGFRELFTPLSPIPVQALAMGAAALGALACWPRLSASTGQQGPSRYTRRPAVIAPSDNHKAAADDSEQPTHLLFRHTAYPVGRNALVVGTTPGSGTGVIRLTGSRISAKHCSIYRQGGAVVLDNHSEYGTRVDGVEVKGSTMLVSGQTIAIGEPPAVLLLIECLPSV
jgi:hypothetical protein